MKSYRKELWFNVPARRGFVNIRREVEECLSESGIQEGMVLVKLAPHRPTNQYRHNDTREDNGDAHMKRQVSGRAAAGGSASWSRS